MSNIIFQENILRAPPLVYPATNFGWNTSQVINANRLQPGLYFGQEAIQVTVNSGDDPLPSLNTERNEFIGMFSGNDDDVDANTGTHNYSFSLYMPSATWKDPQPILGTPYPWCIPFQLHGPDALGVSPAFDLQLSAIPPINTANHYTLELRGGTGPSYSFTALDLGPRLFDQWVAFSLTFDYKGQTVIASVNGTQVVNQAATFGYVVGGVFQNHYLKAGCYRNNSPFTTLFYRTAITTLFVSGT